MSKTIIFHTLHGCVILGDLDLELEKIKLEELWSPQLRSVYLFLYRGSNSHYGESLIDPTVIDNH